MTQAATIFLTTGAALLLGFISGFVCGVWCRPPSEESPELRSDTAPDVPKGKAKPDPEGREMARLLDKIEAADADGVNFGKASDYRPRSPSEPTMQKIWEEKAKTRRAPSDSHD